MPSGVHGLMVTAFIFHCKAAAPEIAMRRGVPSLRESRGL